MCLTRRSGMQLAAGRDRAIFPGKQFVPSVPLPFLSSLPLHSILSLSSLILFFVLYFFLFFHFLFSSFLLFFPLLSFIFVLFNFLSFLLCLTFLFLSFLSFFQLLRFFLFSPLSLISRNKRKLLSWPCCLCACVSPLPPNSWAESCSLYITSGRTAEKTVPLSVLLL
jgi:hypothetical protein